MRSQAAWTAATAQLGEQGVAERGFQSFLKAAVEAVNNANAVLARADGLVKRLDSLVANADRQVFGQDTASPAGSASGGGLVGDARATVQQLNTLLADARGYLSSLRDGTPDDATLQRELGVSYLFITHNIGVVEYIADHVAVMQNGRIGEMGVAEAVLRHPRSGYTKTLLAAVPRIQHA